jgi:hypothetical protein
MLVFTFILGVIVATFVWTSILLAGGARADAKADKRESEDRARKYMITREVLANIEQNKAQHKAGEVK